MLLSKLRNLRFPLFLPLSCFCSGDHRTLVFISPQVTCGCHFFFKINFIGIQLIQKGVLILSVQQSQLYIYLFLFSFFSPIGQYTVLSRFPCAVQQQVLVVYFRGILIKCIDQFRKAGPFLSHSDPLNHFPPCFSHEQPLPSYIPRWRLHAGFLGFSRLILALVALLVFPVSQNPLGPMPGDAAGPGWRPWKLLAFLPPLNTSYVAVLPARPLSRCPVLTSGYGLLIHPWLWGQ